MQIHSYGAFRLYPFFSRHMQCFNKFSCAYISWHNLGVSLERNSQHWNYQIQEFVLQNDSPNYTFLLTIRGSIRFPISYTLHSLNICLSVNSWLNCFSNYEQGWSWLCWLYFFVNCLFVFFSLFVFWFYCFFLMWIANDFWILLILLNPVEWMLFKNKNKILFLSSSNNSSDRWYPMISDSSPFWKPPWSSFQFAELIFFFKSKSKGISSVEKCVVKSQ